MVEIVRTGLYDTIQDLGRYGVQHFGIPVSGVMDRNSAQLANNILNNDSNAAVMEITMTGPKLKFYEATTIVLTGADLSPQLNHNPVALNCLIKINKEDVLSFGKLRSGFRAYLAISGGFLTKVLMNSRSYFKPVTGFSKLQEGDRIPYKVDLSERSGSYSFSKFSIMDYSDDILNVFPGPEYELLSSSQKKYLERLSFSVSSTSNRMAYQFEETLFNELPEILTSPVLPGTVQLTPSGQLIVLMRDSQVTGGYPRILQLSENAIDLLAQKFVGTKVHLKCVEK